MKSSLDYAGSLGLDERIFPSSLINETHAKDDIKVTDEDKKKSAARAPFSALFSPLLFRPVFARIARQGNKVLLRRKDDVNLCVTGSIEVAATKRMG